MKFLAVLFLSALTLSVQAHIGSPNVYFDGTAGAYPVHVIIRPPNVVPGLAEIAVRIEGEAPGRITAFPIYYDAGRKGAPPPDVAKPVRGETNLYSTTLWFMKPGGYGVEVSVEGSRGGGKVVVPVNAVATNTLGMSTSLAVLLTVLATVLFVGAVRIIGAVFGEAGLGPGETMDAARRRRSRIAMAIAAPVILLGLWGGKKWWDFDEKEYRTQTLYQASQMTAGVIVRTNQNVLELALDQENERNQSRRLMPDHGKLMHLFLIREPGLDVFAHLHPLKRSWEDFEVGLPPLPPGRYCAYADITRENGLAETLTATVELPNPSPKMMALWQEESSDQICGNGVVRVAPPEGSPLLPDADDTWHVNHKSTVAVSTNVVPVSGGLTMAWLREGNLVQNRELSLRFQLLGTNGQPEALETYIGMFGHAAIRRDDGAVFAHIHPSGTYSMAAQEYFGGGESPEEPAKSSAPIREVSFPFAFPKPGPYHLWVQVKAHGRVYTGLFLPVVQ